MESKELIDGVEVRDLKIIADERGFVMELLRRDWREFKIFAQSYITACYPNVIKAWHYHKKQTDNFVCVYGMAKVVLYDAREGSKTFGQINEFHIGLLNPKLIKIPPLLYHGFTAEGNDLAMIINFPDQLYNYEEPDEYRIAFNSPTIPYDWQKIHK